MTVLAKLSSDELAEIVAKTANTIGLSTEDIVKINEIFTQCYDRLVTTPVSARFLELILAKKFHEYHVRKMVTDLQDKYDKLLIDVVANKATVHPEDMQKFRDDIANAHKLATELEMTPLQEEVLLSEINLMSAAALKLQCKKFNIPGRGFMNKRGMQIALIRHHNL